MIRVLGTIFAGLLGLAFGSFLNVCLCRWPTGESIVLPGSHCRQCGRTLAWWENIPLVSWLALRGRCRTCRSWIGWRYPLVELAVGVLWTLTAWQFMASILDPRFPTALVYYDLAIAISTLFLLWLLVALAALDAENFWLPDWITLPGIALGLTFTFLRFVTLVKLTSLDDSWWSWGNLAITGRATRFARNPYRCRFHASDSFCLLADSPPRGYRPGRRQADGLIGLMAGPSTSSALVWYWDRAGSLSCNCSADCPVGASWLRKLGAEQVTSGHVPLHWRHCQQPLGCVASSRRISSGPSFESLFVQMQNAQLPSCSRGSRSHLSHYKATASGRSRIVRPVCTTCRCRSSKDRWKPESGAYRPAARPCTIQRIAGMTAKWACAHAPGWGSGTLFPRDAVHDFPARRFDAAGGRSRCEGKLIVLPC
jgi:hypothetical protein